MPTPRKAKTLPNQAALDAAAAEKAQIDALEAVRTANSAALNKSVRDIIGEFVAAAKATAKARKAVEDAEAAQQTALETTYVKLAALAHANDMTTDMIDVAVNAAMRAYYSEDELKVAVSTASKLRSQLKRAMDPKIRAALPAIIKPWQDAWNAETAAKAADKNAATPLRVKFTGRGNMVNTAMVNALENDLCETPEAVTTWVAAHPRAKRGTNAAPAAATAAAVAELPKEATPRQIAEARITGLINAVNEVGSEYPAATALFAAVIDALRLCTSDKLVPATLAPSAANNPLIPPKPPAEPVAGAAELDAAIDPEIAEFRAFQAFQAMKTKAAGK